MRMLPADFKVHINNEIMTISDVDGKVLKVVNLRWLSSRCLNGDRLDASEREFCGAALHFLLQRKGWSLT